MSFEDVSDGDLSDIESDEYRDFKIGRTGIIFLVDARPPMLQNSDGSVHFKTCIDVCRRVIINKMMNPDSVMIGVIIFSNKIKDTTGLTSPKGITTLLELSPPNIDAIKFLQDVISENGIKEFETKTGQSDTNVFSVADALWACSLAFSKCTTKLGSRHIVLFTNDGDPHKDSCHYQHLARQKADDLSQIGISLEVYFMGTLLDTIEKAFYEELMEIANGDSGERRIPYPIEKCEDLLRCVLKEDHRKRAIGRIKFHLSEDLYIGLNMYSSIRKSTGPPKVRLNSRTNERVKSVRQLINMATGAVMLPADIKMKVFVGGKDIYFTTTEKKNLSQVMEPGITLLGFKPKNQINLLDQCRPCSFLYPDEEMVEGSHLLFSALLEQCLEKDKIAICWMTPRKGSYPHLVALLPQREVTDEKDCQLVPEGFHVVYLPFGEYFRDIPVEIAQKPSEEQVDAAKRLVNHLEFQYKESMFPNPKNKALENAIRALALGEAQPEATEDVLESTVRSLSSEVETIAPSFLDEFPVISTQSPKKRPAGTPSKHKQKLLKQDEEVDIPALAGQKKIEKLKVDQLKSYLIDNKITVTGLKKAELVPLVYATVKRNMKT